MDLGKLQSILHDDSDVMMVTMVMCGQAKVDERDGPLLRWRNIDGSHSDKLPALGATQTYLQQNKLTTRNFRKYF